MTVSEAISKLQALEETHGDVDMYYVADFDLERDAWSSKVEGIKPVIVERYFLQRKA